MISRTSSFPEKARSSIQLEYFISCAAQATLSGPSSEARTKLASSVLVAAPCGRYLFLVVTFVSRLAIRGEQFKRRRHTPNIILAEMLGKKLLMSIVTR